MIYLRKANERGHANHGWLDSWHSFSFADYYDPNFMGFSALRVINDDVIDAGQGFGTHPHKDMEILTYVLEGAVEHQDSMGNKEQVPAGEFQIMSAGTGVRHSEYNPSQNGKTAPVSNLDHSRKNRHHAALRTASFRRRAGQTAGAVPGCA